MSHEFDHIHSFSSFVHMASWHETCETLIFCVPQKDKQDKHGTQSNPCQSIISTCVISQVDNIMAISFASIQIGTASSFLWLREEQCMLPDVAVRPENSPCCKSFCQMMLPDVVFTENYLVFERVWHECQNEMTQNILKKGKKLQQNVISNSECLMIYDKLWKLTYHLYMLWH